MPQQNPFDFDSIYGADPQQQADDSIAAWLAQDPTRAAAYTAYSGAQMAGRGLGQVVGTAAGVDTRSPMEKRRDAVEQIKRNMAASQVAPGSPEYYEQLIAEFKNAGMLDSAAAAAQQLEALKRSRAQTGAYEREYQPKPPSAKDRLTDLYWTVTESLANDPENATLQAKKAALEKALGIKEQPAQPSADWQLVQGNDRNPPTLYNKRTGETRRLSGQGQGFGGAAAAASGLTGDDFLATLPAEKAAQVKALAEGRMSFPGGFALKSAYWQDMLSAVAQYDPTFDYVNYNARAKTRNAFVAGREGQSLNALNTVMGHLDDLEKAATALNNTAYPWLNSLENAIGSQISPDLKGRLNAFKINVQAVASEMERAYRGTGGNMAEIEAWKAAMDAADSPQAIRAGLQQAVRLLGSKIDALGDQYNKGMGTSGDGLELLTPKAQDTYNRLSGRAKPEQQPRQPKPSPGGKVRVIRPDGRTSMIPRSQLDAALQRGYQEAE